jgi:multisubunit Na+/H+ antiporter MnhB subunit
MSQASDQGHATDQPAAPPGPPKPFADLAERILLPLGLAVLSAVGAATYALLRQTYLSFYRPFATSPEDVGVGQLQMLAGFVRSRPVVLGAAALVFCVLAVPLVLRPRTNRWRLWAGLGLLAVGAIVVGVVAALLGRTEARFQATIEKVNRGEAVVSCDLPYITVQVFPARLLWKGDKDGAPDELVGKHPHPLMYLGHADGKAIVYDRATTRTWVVSEDDVLIALQGPPKTVCPGYR